MSITIRPRYYTTTMSRNRFRVVAAGAQGPPGPAGANGAAGAPGVGVPTGGTTGQALVKVSNTNYDTTWSTVSAIPGGSSGQLQWNNGVFAGTAAGTYSTTGTHFTMTAQATNVVPLAVLATSGQTSPLFEARNSSGTANLYIDASCNQHIRSGMYLRMYRTDNTISGDMYLNADNRFYFTRDIASAGGLVLGNPDLIGSGWTIRSSSGSPVTIGTNVNNTGWSAANVVINPQFGAVATVSPLVSVRNSNVDQFVIGPTGQVCTNQTAAATVLGSVTRRLPIYNAGGTLIGYAPLYDSIT